MRSLQDLRVFVETARQGSLSGAARHMDLSPAVASAAVKRLEEDVGAALFVRSTRSLRLTLQGEMFLDHARQALQLLDDGYQALQTGDAPIHDLLQISMPSDLGRNVILPWLDAFADSHPGIELRLQLSDRLVNVYQQPVDIALRYGQPADSNLIALPIMAGNYRVLCASPGYLKQHGEPVSPEELDRHNCLCFLLGDDKHARWHFSKGLQNITVRVSGNRTADDGDAVRRWALAGKGIAYKSMLDVYEDISQERLVALCTDWETEPAPLNLLCADRRQLTPAVQALRVYLSQHCEVFSNLDTRLPSGDVAR